MNPNFEEILQINYKKFIEEKGITSISTKEFPKAYLEPVLQALKEAYNLGVQNVADETRRETIHCQDSPYDDVVYKIDKDSILKLN
jgi:hypothetical protein